MKWKWFDQVVCKMICAWECSRASSLAIAEQLGERGRRGSGKIGPPARVYRRCTPVSADGTVCYRRGQAACLCNVFTALGPPASVPKSAQVPRSRSASRLANPNALEPGPAFGNNIRCHKPWRVESCGMLVRQTPFPRSPPSAPVAPGNRHVRECTRSAFDIQGCETIRRTLPACQA